MMPLNVLLTAEALTHADTFPGSPAMGLAWPTVSVSSWTPLAQTAFLGIPPVFLLFVMQRLATIS